ncbi:terminase small subunit [Clostridium perfringens]|nr:terminase small subunit [Clostridium perfringens]
MPRARSPNVDKAYKLYKKGYKLVDISKELNIPAGTVRRWKKTYNWDSERSKDNEQLKDKKNVKSEKQQDFKEEAKTLVINEKLTDNQRLFCAYYIKCFNATRAYKKAYKCSYETAMVEGSRTLRKPKIKETLDELRVKKISKILLTEEDIFQRYIDIAFADIGDYLTFRKKRIKHWTVDEDGNEIAVLDPETGEQKYSEYNVVELNDSSELDTSILLEVSESKDGVKIKLQDQMKALQWLSEHMNIANDKQKAEVELLKSKTKLNEKNSKGLFDLYSKE